jgi:hypothetical protein
MRLRSREVAPPLEQRAKVEGARGGAPLVGPPLRGLSADKVAALFKLDAEDRSSGGVPRSSARRNAASGRIVALSEQRARIPTQNLTKHY